jgi:hypothetical protein
MEVLNIKRASAVFNSCNNINSMFFNISIDIFYFIFKFARGINSCKNVFIGPPGPDGIGLPGREGERGETGRPGNLYSYNKCCCHLFFLG